MALKGNTKVVVASAAGVILASWLLTYLPFLGPRR